MRSLIEYIEELIELNTKESNPAVRDSRALEISRLQAEVDKGIDALAYMQCGVL